ncbi:MAG: hypothetical protein WEB63_02435 [Cucumibacter sp.]
MAEDAPAREADQIEGIHAPEETRALIGHAEAGAQMLAAFEAGRLHHAWLIEGPRGIGKATFAYDLSRAILGRTADEAPARIAEQIAQGAYPNLRIVRRRRNDKTEKFYTEIVIEDVRGLIGYFQHTSGRAGTRIAVVDPVEELSPGAANALLKTLEEPPPNGLLLLITHRPGLVMATIRSRCRTLSLRPLAYKDVRAVVGASGIEAGAGAVDQAVELAEGRPRKALEALVLGETKALSALKGWLGAKEKRGVGHLPIAAELSKGAGASAYPVAIEMISEWISGRARGLAKAGGAGGPPLAMLSSLWEKARGLDADRSEYNLDRRQTLVTILDAIRDLEEPSRPAPR